MNTPMATEGFMFVDTKSWVLLGLSLISVMLVGAIVLEWQTCATLDDRDLPYLNQPVPALPGAPRVRGANLDAGDIVLRRPLFELNRRPAAIQTAGNPADNFLLRLTGVVITSSGRTILFQDLAKKGTIIATEGTPIGKFVVQSINAAGATVLGPRGAQDIRPTFDNKPAALEGIGKEFPPGPAYMRRSPHAPYSELPTVQP